MNFIHCTYYSSFAIFRFHNRDMHLFLNKWFRLKILWVGLYHLLLREVELKKNLINLQYFSYNLCMLDNCSSNTIVINRKRSYMYIFWFWDFFSAMIQTMHGLSLGQKVTNFFFLVYISDLFNEHCYSVSLGSSMEIYSKENVLLCTLV